MRTVKATFEREADAKTARDWLVAEGIDPQRLSLLDRSRPVRMPPGVGASHGKGLWANIKDIVSGPEETRPAADEGLKPGGYLLTASVPEEKLEGVLALLSKSGTVEFEGDDSDVDAGDEVRLPVVEEELRLGTHQVAGEGVRLTSHVTERPVHERVQLRDYRVSVERHATDRAVGANPAALEELFRERVVEMVETTDEVRFLKEARVREEVIVRRQAHERVEEIDTTLRRTEVDIERLPAGATPERSR